MVFSPLCKKIVACIHSCSICNHFPLFFQELSHENVIGMRDVFGTGSNVAIVMDFMDTDLEVIIKDTSIILTPAHIKTYTLQTLKGLEYLHQNWILHR